MSFIKKKEVLTKVHQFMREVKKNGNKINNVPRAMVINYNNACNFRCDFCYSTVASSRINKTTLSLDKVKDLANEADELGIWEIVLQGGELTMNKNALIELIEALGPQRFQVVLITNGYLITRKYAQELLDAGLDCLAVSLSTMNAEAHDKERHIKNSHERALKALEYAKDVGLAAWPNVIFGHHNAFSDELQELLDWTKEKEYPIYFIMAMPYGSFKEDKMDANDMKRLDYIRKNYNCYFNTWDMYDPKKEKITGCWSVNRSYISPLGDVFPCPFLPIRIGNVYENSLKEILDYGFSIKHFGEYSPICIAAFNHSFRKKYLKENSSIFKYDDAKEVFSEKDYIKKTDIGEIKC